MPQAKKAAAKRASRSKPTARKTAAKKSAAKGPEVDRTRNAAPTDDRSEASADEQGTASVQAFSAEQLEAQEHQARAAHNRRTGGGEVHEGELQRQRDEHNRRTAGASA